MEASCRVPVGADRANAHRVTPDAGALKQERVVLAGLHEHDSLTALMLILGR